MACLARLLAVNRSPTDCIPGSLDDLGDSRCKMSSSRLYCSHFPPVGESILTRMEDRAFDVKRGEMRFVESGKPVAAPQRAHTGSDNTCRVVPEVESDFDPCKTLGLD